MANIIRADDDPTANFVMIYNTTARDNTLSLRARGLLTYLLSQKPGWRTSGRALAAVMVEGKSVIFATMKELEHKGYIRRARASVDGRWVHDLYVYSTPRGIAAEDTMGPCTENEDMEPCTEIRDTVNRDIKEEDQPKKTRNPRAPAR